MKSATAAPQDAEGYTLESKIIHLKVDYSSPLSSQVDAPKNQDECSLGLQLPQNLVDAMFHHRLTPLGLLQEQPLLFFALLLHCGHPVLPFLGLSSLPLILRALCSLHTGYIDRLEGILTCINTVNIFTEWGWEKVWFGYLSAITGFE